MKKIICLAAFSLFLFLGINNAQQIIGHRLGAVTPVGAVMAMSGTAGSEAAAVEEQAEFTVVLADAGARKIYVIKEVRVITGLGLKEAKDLVEGAPQNIKEGVSKENAEKFKKQLEAAGAKVELK